MCGRAAQQNRESVSGTRTSSRSSAIRGVRLRAPSSRGIVTALLLVGGSLPWSADLNGQSPLDPPSRRTTFLGPTVAHYQLDEGGEYGITRSHGVALGLSGGIMWRSGWGLQAEYLLHHPENFDWVYFDIVRKRRTGTFRPWIAAGCCYVHLALGLDLQLGSRYVVAPGIDLNAAFVSGVIRLPRLGLFMRW